MLVHSWSDKVDGKRVLIKATVESEKRQVLAEGIAVFVVVETRGRPPVVEKGRPKI